MDPQYQPLLAIACMAWSAFVMLKAARNTPVFPEEDLGPLVGLAALVYLAIVLGIWIVAGIAALAPWFVYSALT